MNFLIFVTTFVALACVVLPVAVLAAFALMRDAGDQGWHEPPSSRPDVWSGATRSRTRSELRLIPGVRKRKLQHAPPSSTAHDSVIT